MEPCVQNDGRDLMLFYYDVTLPDIFPGRVMALHEIYARLTVLFWLAGVAITWIIRANLHDQVFQTWDSTGFKREGTTWNLLHFGLFFAMGIVGGACGFPLAMTYGILWEFCESMYGADTWEDIVWNASGYMLGASVRELFG